MNNRQKRVVAPRGNLDKGLLATRKFVKNINGGKQNFMRQKPTVKKSNSQQNG